MTTIEIGGRKVGDGQPCYVIAEAGVNHNGSLDIAFKLIDAAKEAGADAVKFQKRTIDICYTKAELESPRESPWGHTFRQQKEGLEFSQSDYERIDRHCRAVDIHWFASCWDIPSVQFISQFEPPCYKVASACLTDKALLEFTASKRKPVLLSTGMSTADEIRLAVYEVWKVVTGGRVPPYPLNDAAIPIVLMHCTSTYPSTSDELNLSCIRTLKEQYQNRIPVGYSGHEIGLQTTLAAVALGACVVERHITLDRSMYGSDQAASIEPHGFKQLVRDIREIEKAMGDGVKRVYDSELPIKKKLRKVETLLQGLRKADTPTELDTRREAIYGDDGR